MRKFLFLLAVAVLSAGCGDKSEESLVGPKLNLLFVGNSYTFVNNLPQMLTQLARSGGHPVSASTIAPGGWTLAQHAGSKETPAKIASQKWDFVILQDQSVEPSLARERDTEMFPAVRTLNNQIQKAGAQSMLYMTWGRQKGLPEEGFKDYETMQAQLTLGYMTIAQELNLRVAPVGEAWKNALGHDPSWALWQADGSHPTEAGTYLAACVFYAAFYQKSPEGLGYTSGLSKSSAGALQTIASETVLTDPAKWNIR